MNGTEHSVDHHLDVLLHLDESRLKSFASSLLARLTVSLAATFR